MKVVKKDVVTTVGSFSKKVSHDLKRGTLKYLRKKFNWNLLLTVEENSSIKEIENSVYC